MVKVAVGIIIQNGLAAPDFSQVLMCQRKPTAPYPLKWEFPGGKFENGETAEECLLRELKEELDIVAEVGGLYHREHYMYPDSGTFDVHYHLVPSFSGVLVNRAFTRIRWVPVADLPKFDILEGNRAVIQKLLSAHEGNEPGAR
jgi:mutator protein MutT